MAKFEGPDFFHDTPARAMGSETEYTVQIDSMPNLWEIKATQPHIVHASYDDELWLENGSRVYYDLPNNPVLEYATPECLSADEVLVHEKAGEVYATMIAREITRDNLTFPLYKRAAYCDIVSASGEPLLVAKSAGHHENYSTPLLRKRRHALARQALTSYLATRPIWAGAGMVGNHGYQLSQKHAALTYLSIEGSLTGHGAKAVTRIQDDRIEVRSGDGNMSPWAIRTKFAMTSLVLRLLEHGAFPSYCLLGDPRHRQKIANYAANSPRSTLRNGDIALSPISHQQRIAIAALEFCDTHAVPDEERQAAEDILAICNTLIVEEPIVVVAEQLADRVDWAAKLTYIHRSVGLRGTRLDSITSNTLRAVKCDLEWEALGRGAPSTRHYSKTTSQVDTAAVSIAMTQPPNTRAKLRTEYAEISRGVEAMFWTFVTPSGPFPSIGLDSPYLDNLKPAKRQLKLVRRQALDEIAYPD